MLPLISVTNGKDTYIIYTGISGIDYVIVVSLNGNLGISYRVEMTTDQRIILHDYTFQTGNFLINDFIDGMVEEMKNGSFEFKPLPDQTI